MSVELVKMFLLLLKLTLGLEAALLECVHAVIFGTRSGCQE